jgi:hypothetical protein
MNARIRQVFSLGLLVGCMAAFGLAQRNTGTILGTVTDPSGASIVGAEVVVTNSGTNEKRTMVTGDTGNYVMENLSPGTYEVMASVAGFKSKSIKGITLLFDQRARIDIGLEVGEMTEQISVEGVAPIIATDQSSVGEVVETKKVLELPLNGRNFLQLATLTPGARKASVSYMEITGGSISVNGMSDHANNTQVDGMMNQERGAGRMNFSPSIDMIQEFKIQTSIYDAEYGSTGAAQISLITKSGTKDYHGSLYYFHRNDNLDARPFFQPGELPEFKRHQFGGTVGGPIGKSEKDFFFFSYEGLREARGLTALMTVPTAAIRNGDFSGTGATIYDPATLDPTTGLRQPFPGNQIPLNRITSQSSYFLQFWPNPISPGFANNAVSNPVRSFDNNQYSIRYDRKFSKDSIDFRFTRNKLFNLDPLPRGENLPVTGFREVGTFLGYNHRLGWTHIFNPTTLNSLAVGFSQYNQTRCTEPSSQFGCVSSTGNVFEKAGIQGVSPERQNDGFPAILVSGWQPLADNTFSPVKNPFDNYLLTETFSKVAGKHSWKVGGEIVYNRMGMNFDANTRGRISFNPNYTTAGISRPGNQFNSFADFLLGQVASSSLNAANLLLDTRQSWYSGFVQDHWNVTKDLTLDLGLRYDYWLRPIDTRNRITGIDLKTQRWVFPGSIPTLPGTPPNSVTAEQAGYPRSLLLSGDKNDFSPRVGFAWRMFGDSKTVLRGGYGMFYNWIVLDVAITAGFGPPWVPPISIVSNPDRPAVTLANPYESAIVPATTGRGLIGDNRTPYTQQYSMSLSRELTPTLGLDVSYVGNAGRKNTFQYDFNAPAPGPGSVASRRPYPAFQGLGGPVTWGTSHYDALQAKVRKELGREGLLLLGSYAWGKALGNSVSGPQFQSQPIRDARNWKDDYGPTQFDTRHILTMSFIYELPFGKGKPVASGVSGFADTLISGWKVAGISSFQSGQRLTVFDVFNSSNAGGSRPDAIGDPKLDHSSTADKVSRFFNTSAFVRAPLFTYGNSGVGNVEGPGLHLWDLSIYKDVLIKERVRVQFRTEFFNAFNHANFGNPGTTFGTANFGVISSAGEGRDIQFGLRIQF